jgi:hypothetical protein
VGGSAVTVEKEFYEVFATYYSLDEIVDGIAANQFELEPHVSIPPEPVEGDALYKVTIKVELIPR